jgi:glyoxalase/bleomycin resistance protein/dioxygenase superfamily protein
MKNVTLSGFTYEGRPSKPKADFGFSQQGDLQIELIAPKNDAPSGYRDFLANGQSGEHHHGWFCEDWAGEFAAAESAGRRVLQHGNWGGVRFAYYHPAGEELFGELIEMNELSRQLFALIRREAEQWDGTRPSRSLLAAADWGMRWTAVKVQIATLLGRG